MILILLSSSDFKERIIEYRTRDLYDYDVRIKRIDTAIKKKVFSFAYSFYES